MRPRHRLGDVSPQRDPHRVSVHQALLTVEMLHAGIEGNEDRLRARRGQPVHQPRVAVLLLDDDLDAGQGSGEAYRRGDVPPGANDDEGPELAEDPGASGDGEDEAEGEEEVGGGKKGSGGAHRGNGGESEAGGGDGGGLEAGVGADEEDFGVGAGVLDSLGDRDPRVYVSPCAAACEDDAQRGGRRRCSLKDGRGDQVSDLK